ncbi:protein mono-ADP-ribosyltransferase PARP4 [Eucyclogobius newberryi]|uniref:protein mono-ADP-ribosyltransferase PARP4 n=1 Tax=Eucyclogobius newberryi TaxID=166745 RepID=UPI003B5C8220
MIYLVFPPCVDKWSQSTDTSITRKCQDKPVQPVYVPLKEESPKGTKKNDRVYTETDHELPKCPESFQVAKYSIFQKPKSRTWCLLELQSAKSDTGRQYCVVRYRKDDVQSKKAAVRDQVLLVSTSEEAVKVYQDLTDSMKADGLEQKRDVPLKVTEMGSAPLQQLLLEEKLNSGALSPEVGVFVELLWQEALGCVDLILNTPVHKISLNDVTRAEGLLLQTQRKLTEHKMEEVLSLWSEYRTLLAPRFPVGPNMSSVSKQFDLCQLIRDILNVSEMTLGSAVPSSMGKYRALRCGIEGVPPESSEFKAVTSLLRNSKLKVHQILRVNRAPELQHFKRELGNIKPLLHSSSPHNFVGILSRGLLLPHVAVDQHGIQRTDAGDLGSGIYFSGDINTSLKYSQCSSTDGSRLMLVCDVALGRCRDLLKKDLTLTQAPEGHDSVHGVQVKPGLQSEFTDDEYVVYSADQVKLKYVVQLSLEGEELKRFTPEIVTSVELPSTDPGMDRDEDNIDNIKNPLENVTAGLLNSSGQQIPLQAVHVKCKLMDLLAQVIIFQKYTNESSVPIEAKYVFPLDDSAAVSGFEAFINGKHVVGQVKEKETARREYKQAIERGHGAYLMDQDAPDVFTISVGNLPPGATVLIKVTFVSELVVTDGSIFFSLPCSVAPWQESAALNQTTQVTVEKVCVTDDGASTREFNLDMSIEMPNEITKVKCTTHKVNMKKTDCRAVVSVLPGEVMGPEGFQLLVTLTEVHVPRMWVEKHPSKDSQACMLVFYPKFEAPSSTTSDEVVLLLDASQSMKGESLNSARMLALQILKTLDRNVRLNVIVFGTDHTESFLSARPIVEARQETKNFIKHFLSAGGSTELWRPLRALSLLPPSSGTRNLLLLSDGHIQNPELTLQLIRENSTHSRLFTCGLSPTANRHMLRALAQAGCGAYEFFDTKSKHTWSEKVSSQVKRMMAPGARSVSVKWQQFNPTAPPPVQAPKQLHALFNDCHTLVFGFVPHCTQATLLGDLSGEEIKTMVSTSELQKTKGTFLHKLTARAIIRDFEDGSLDMNAVLHEEKKAELKSLVIELSKEFSILSQFTSFVAIEERDSGEERGFTDIPKLIAEEDVDFLPYMSWVDEDEKNSLEEFDSDHLLDYEEDESEGNVLTSSQWAEKRSIAIEENLKEDGYEGMDECYGDIGEPDGAFPSSEEETCVMSQESSPYCDFDSEYIRRFYQQDERISITTQHAHEEGLAAPSAARQYGLIKHSGFAFGHSPPPPPPTQIGASLAALPDSDLLCFGSVSLNRLKSGDMPPPPPPPTQIGASLAALPDSDLLCFGSVSLNRLKSGDMPPPPPPPTQIGALLAALPDSDLLCFGSVSLNRLKSGDMPPPPPPPTQIGASLAALPDSDLLCFGSVSLNRLKSGAMPPPPPPLAQFPKPSISSLESPGAPSRQHLAGSSSLFGSARQNILNQMVLGRTMSRPSLSQVPKPSISSLESPGAPALRRRLVGKARSWVGGDARRLSNECQPLPAAQVTKPSICAFPPPHSQQMKAMAQLSRAVTLSAPALDQNWSRIGPKFSIGATKEARRTNTLPSDMVMEDISSFTEKTCSRRSMSITTMPFIWRNIFSLQHLEGYWELTPQLGNLLNCDISRFADDFLKRKGITSLGFKAHADILKLLATLLVLQLMRVKNIKEGQMLRSLFCLENNMCRPDHWEEVNKAVKWVCWADRQYPCIYSRLEFGLSWDSSTKQLLGAEKIPLCSPLTGLNLNPVPYQSPMMQC